jgi:quercetin dioxygenase-like cupin family protein
MSLAPEQLRRFTEQLVATPERWAHLVHHCGDVRVYAQIWDEEDVNAWMICWSEDQDTGFHDHDESAAAILVVEGQVREERLRLAAGPDVRVIGPGAPFYIAPTAIHRVLHAGVAPAVTIHAYSPPLTRTGAYRTGPAGQLERVAQSCEQELRAAPALR